MKKEEKVVKRNREAELVKKYNKKKVKPLPNKLIPMGGGPFVGRYTTG